MAAFNTYYPLELITTSERTNKHSSQKFYGGNESFEYVENRGWHCVFNNEGLKKYVEANPRTKIREIAAKLGVCSKAVSKHTHKKYG